MLLYGLHTTPAPPPAPWIEVYNETHHIKLNFTHSQMLESPEEKVDVTSLGFSNDAQKASDLFT